MPLSHPLLVRFVLAIVFPLVLLLGAASAYFWRSLPVANEQRALQGITAVINVTRDSQGVPRIAAETDDDVFFAMGYLHAQDRMWQLEVQRRIAQGRLSELFGREALQKDLLLRTLGLYQTVPQSWAALDTPAQKSLQAYANGVNAWLASKPVLPPEFAAFQIAPQPWTVYDSLAWIKVFSLNLSGNFNSEITHFVAAQVLSPAQMASFFRSSAPPPKVADNNRAGLLGLGTVFNSLETSLGLTGRFVGSNAWVVSGRLTASGNPILANDPHMGLQMPSAWYPVKQDGARLHSAGMSLVGLPLVIFGKNTEIAWGGTNMMADVQDLFFEQIDPQHPSQYRTAGGWQPFDTRTELISVRADFPAFLREPPAPVRATVRSTRNGPVVSDVMGIGDEPVSLRWTSLDGGDRTYESFLYLNYAHDWTSFRSALKNYVAPALNMLYADVHGNIGFQGIGKIPLRAAGNGVMPTRGWEGSGAWTGFIPFENMPSSYNPERGYLVSANDRNIGADYPYFISSDWAPPSRAKRIAQLIEARKTPGLAVGDMALIAGDVVSLPARDMRAILLTVEAQSDRQKQALAYLRQWDGAMATDSQAAAIFNVWLRHVKQHLFAQRLSQDYRQRLQLPYIDAMLARLSVDDLREIITRDGALWCKPTPGAARICQAELLGALDDALSELQKLAGADMEAWSWGKIHNARYSHTPFGDSRLLSRIFGVRVESGGSSDTVNAANASFVRPDGYVQSFGATFRQIMELGTAPQRHLFTNSGGQSGNVLSPHYADMTKRFVRFDFSDFSQPALPSLTLIPKPARHNQDQQP